MTKARKPEPKSASAFQPQQKQFSSQPIAAKAEECEAPAGESRVSFSLADIDIFPREMVQPKLKLGPVGDRYEQEADQVASRVVEAVSSSDQDQVQRKADAPLRRKIAAFSPARDSAISPGIESAIQRARSGGKPLPDGVRMPMERAFGADFGGVRLHDDAQADSLNRSIQARAFTTGRDIFLRKGEYRPASSEGQRLLAHELTHVVQQNWVAVQGEQMQAAGRVLKANEEAPPNKTGMPDQLKLSLGNLFGMDLSSVSVRYSSSKPAQLMMLPSERLGELLTKGAADGRKSQGAYPAQAEDPANTSHRLEEEANRMGSRALGTAPQQLRAAIGGSGSGVIQRSLGFEYELGSVETYDKDATGNKVRLRKGQVLKNQPSFNVTADDPPTGSELDAMSDLELITNHIDDTIPANRGVLKTNLEAMVAYLGTLRANPAETAVGASFVGAGEATYYDDGVLQATAGLSSGGLANLVSGSTENEAGRERTEMEAKKTALAKKFFVYKRDEKNLELQARIRHITLQEFHAMGVFDRKLYECSLMQLGHLTEAKSRLIAAVMSRIIAIPVNARVSNNLPYPKAAAGALMARSDFATIINALPDGITDYFATVDIFKNALLLAIRLATEMEGVQLTDRIFPSPVGGAAQLTLTMNNWFEELYRAADRSDLLTSANYPGGDAANPEREQLESLGSYGARTDPQAFGATRRSIFEFRNLGSVVVSDLVSRGLAIWDLVQRANRDTEA